MAGHIDDLTFDPAVNHVLRDRLHHKERACHIDREHAIEIGTLHLDNRRGCEQPRIIDQNVNLSKAILCFTDGGIDALLITHIQMNGMAARAQTVRLQPIRLLRRARDIYICDAHICTLAQIRFGKLETDPSCCAGDQRRLMLQSAAHPKRMPCSSNLWMRSSVGTNETGSPYLSVISPCERTVTVSARPVP